MALLSGCESSYEVAEYLDITEEFLEEALDYYHEKYGCYIELDQCDLYFEPTLLVLPHDGD